MEKPYYTLSATLFIFAHHVVKFAARGTQVTIILSLMEAVVIIISFFIILLIIIQVVRVVVIIAAAVVKKVAANRNLNLIQEEYVVVLIVAKIVKIVINLTFTCVIPVKTAVNPFVKLVMVVGQIAVKKV
jgi:hypothetical protein